MVTVPAKVVGSEGDVGVGGGVQQGGRADVLSRLALPDEKLLASIDTVTVDAFGGSVTRKSPELIRNVARTTPKPHM